jgi:cysteine desulfurase
MEECSTTDVMMCRLQRFALRFKGIDSQVLLLLLENENIYVSTGSACLAGSDSPSHVISAMKPELAGRRDYLRFALDESNTVEEINFVLNTLSRLVEVLRK